MAQPARKPATYEDILALPRHVNGEIIDGVLYKQSRPAKPHAAASSALNGELGPPFGRGRGGPGGWILLFEPEVHLGRDIVVPDLGGWRRERMPTLDDAAYFTLAPDWVCEVLSPSTAKLDRTAKLGVYLNAEVSHVWLVDPKLRTLEVLERAGAQWSLLGTHKDDDRVRAKPFHAFELDLSVLWTDVTSP